MCTGIEPWVIASLIGGTGAQVVSNQQKADAMEGAAKAEMIRQSAMDEQKAATFKDMLAEATAPRQQERINTSQASIEGDLTRDVNVPKASYTSPASTAPRVVQDYADKAASDEVSFVNALAKPRAKLGAWREGLGDFATMLADKGWSVDEINRRLGRSAQIGQMEAQEAYQNTGNELALVGNLATTAGAMGLGNALFAKGAAGAVPKAAGAVAPASVVSSPKFGMRVPGFDPYAPIY